MQQHLLLQFHSVQKTKPAVARQHQMSPRNNADVSGGVSFFHILLSQTRTEDIVGQPGPKDLRPQL